MNIGMATIEKINRVQARAKQLGFSFVKDPISNTDTIALAVIQETLPALVNDCIVFTGSLNEVDAFTRGLAWARHYDTLLGLKTTQRRAASEKKMRDRQFLKLFNSEEK